MANGLGNTKLANKLQEEKWDVLDSAEKEDVGIYLKKYYPKGYNLLAKTLNTLEKSERSCYDGCIHKLVNEKNLSTIVRALENLAQVDPQVNSLVDKNLDTNNTFRIPTINGMPIGGYGIIGDRVKNAVKDINDFFKKSGEILKDRINGTSKDGFYQSTKSSANIDSGFGQRVNDKFIRQSQNDIGDGGFNDNGFGKSITGVNRDVMNNLSYNLKDSDKPTYSNIENEDKTNNSFKSTVGKIYDGIDEGGRDLWKFGRSIASSSLDVLSAVSGGGIKQFANDLSKDLKNYDPDNTDIARIKNAKYLSAYKGKPIVKNDVTSLTNGLFSNNMAIFDLIFLDKELKGLDDETSKNLVQHEYGHTQQFENLGPLGYIIEVAIPSVTGYLSGVSGKAYDQQPWENGAEILGGNKEEDFYDKVGSRTQRVGLDTSPYSIDAFLRKKLKEIDSWH